MALTNVQKVVGVGLIVFVLMSLFPPWTYTFDRQSTYSEKPAGYAFILKSPPPERNSYYHGIRIDTTRLFIQWIVLGVIIGGLVILTKEKAERRKP